MDRNPEYLRLLGIGNIVFGGLGPCCSSFPVVHLVMGVSMLRNPQSFGPPGSTPVQPEIAWVFILMAVFTMVIGWIVSLTTIFAGTSILSRKRYMFCMVVAAIQCAFFPVGTALGVLTIILLLKPEVKEAFGVRSSG